jgi:hypothetical protein
MPLHTDITTIPPRFSGLPGLAHGGYVAGVVATALDAAAAEVRLRRPIPLDGALTLERTAADTAELRDGESVLALGRATDVTIDVPEPVTLAQALTASEGFPGFQHHLFPRCVGCGPANPEGLHIHPGPVAGRRLAASPWVPDASLADASGHVPTEVVWASLDCPQLWALILDTDPAGTERVVTSSLAARIERPVVAGEPHVVIAWPMGRTERGPVAGAAVFTADGELCAAGRQATATVTGWGVPLGRDHHRTDPDTPHDNN